MISFVCEYSGRKHYKVDHWAAALVELKMCETHLFTPLTLNLLIYKPVITAVFGLLHFFDLWC